MEKNFDVKEIAVTVGIYFVLISAFSWIGNKIFDFEEVILYIDGITNGYIFEFIEGLFRLAVPFVGFYIISLFSLKNKTDIKYSSVIILLVLLFLTFSNIFSEYNGHIGMSNYMKQLGGRFRDWMPFTDVFLTIHSIDIIKIIAFIMALCKIYIKPSNLSEETDENSSEKNLTIGYGIVGYVSCVLIFISPYLFIGAIIGLIIYQKKKIS